MQNNLDISVRQFDTSGVVLRNTIQDSIFAEIAANRNPDWYE